MAKRVLFVVQQHVALVDLDCVVDDKVVGHVVLLLVVGQAFLVRAVHFDDQQVLALQALLQVQEHGVLFQQPGVDWQVDLAARLHIVQQRGVGCRHNSAEAGRAVVEPDLGLLVCWFKVTPHMLC